LQLLLKYPSPQEPHGPHTFVDDAIYLKDHLNAAGGSAIILKYTGKAPTPLSPVSRPSTPSFQGFTLRHRTLGARSPLSSSRLLQHPGGVEALFQGAAKGVIERGEKLGINQAVRDAMGEIRRNVQGFNDTRNSPRMFGRSDGGGPMPAAVAVMERRNRQLAAMLDETVTNLKVIATSNIEGDKEKYVEMIELAAAKIQLVKLHLEDSSLSLPEEELPAINTLSISPHTDRKSPTVALDTTQVVMTSSAVESARSTLSSPDSAAQLDAPLPPIPAEDAPLKAASPSLSQARNGGSGISLLEEEDRMDTDAPEPQPGHDATMGEVAEDSILPAGSPVPVAKARPPRPIPTRSSLAQSSFSWMLEPDDTIASMKSSSTTSASPPHPYFPITRPSSNGPTRKGASNSTSNASRERNAFLFGEVTSSDGAGRGSGPAADEIFGLLPIRKGKGRGAKSELGL